MKEIPYTAPALEKGLELLALLCNQSAPLTGAEIAKAMGRSKAEIYRSLVTLEMQGFIRRDEGLKYIGTDLAFDLGLYHPPRQQLIDVALPYMRRLARETDQSCHLSVVNRNIITVVAYAESEAMVAFSIRVGYSIALAHSASGRVIYAFQDAARQLEWLAEMRRDFDRQTVRQFKEEASEVRENGFLVKDSPVTRGIVDLGTPIFNGQQPAATASLIVPFLNHRRNRVPRDRVLEKLIETARLISSDLY